MDYAFAPTISVSLQTRTPKVWATTTHRGGLLLRGRPVRRASAPFAALSSPIRRLQIVPNRDASTGASTTTTTITSDVGATETGEGNMMMIENTTTMASSSASNRVPPKRKRNVVALQLRLLLARLAHMSKAMRRFRDKNAAGLRYARLAIAGVFGVVFLQRMMFSAPTTALATLATAEAGVAIPATPGALSLIPEGMKVALRPFTESFGVVFLSEFGDKSMFATALMAMKHSPSLVLIGALIALTLMTLIACFLGQLMHLLPTNITHYSTIALFVFFGLQMLWSARSLSATPGQGSEKKDAEELVADNFHTTKKDSALSVLAKISSLIFVAEWCDRSMIATMALAASSNSLAVVGGATAANILCTGLAVGSAALVASKISERTVAIIAGVLFEFFAVFTWFEGPEGAPGA